ncbi:165_t:CDS:1, partial [Scutellospora calospora]
MYKLYNFLCCFLLFPLFAPIITPSLINRSCYKPRFFDPSSNTVDQCHFEERSNNCGCCELCTCPDDLDFYDVDVNVPAYEDINVGNINICRPAKKRPFFSTPTIPSCN